MTTGPKTYSYKTRAEKTATVLAGTAALLTYGAGLACIFNGVALVGVLSVSAASALTTQYDFSHIILRRKTPPFLGISGMTRLDGALDDGPGDNSTSLATAQNTKTLLHAIAGLSAQMGLPTPPVYLAEPDAVAQLLLPAGLRWVMRFGYVRRRILPTIFGAEPDEAALIVTRESLRAGHDLRSLRFIMAHEIAHLKTDRRDFAHLAHLWMQGATRILFWGCVGMAGFAAIGLPLPLAGPALGLVGLPAAHALVLPLYALGGLAATWAAGNVFTRYASRLREIRADRNALFVTRDLIAAERVMDHIHHAPQSKKEPKEHEARVWDIWAGHPSHQRRVESLRQSFCRVNNHPVRLGAKDDSAPTDSLKPGF